MARLEPKEGTKRKSVVAGTDQGDGNTARDLGSGVTWVGDEDNERKGKDGEEEGLIGCSKICRLVGKEERPLHVHERY